MANEDFTIDPGLAKALSEVNKILNTFTLEMYRAQKAIDDGNKSSDALAKVTNVLAQQIDVQKSKISLLQAAHSSSSAATGENSKSTQKYQDQLQRAQEKLDKLISSQDLGAKKTDELSGQFEKAEKSSSVLDRGLAKASKSASEVGSGFDKGKSCIEEFSTTSQAGGSEIGNLSAKLGAVSALLKGDFSGAVTQAGTAIGGELGGAVAGLTFSALETGLKGASSVAKGFASAIGGTLTVGCQLSAAAIKGVASATVAVGQASIAAIQGIYNLATKSNDLVDAQDVVKRTFGDAGDEINNWANNMVGSAGLSKTAATQMVGSMGNLLNSMGTVPEQSAKMSQELTGLAGNMGKFYGMGSDKAFELLKAGISGSASALSELGISMEDTDLENFAAKTDQSYAAMNEAEKATLRYKYMMEQTSEAQGAFADSSANLSTQQQMMKANWESLSAVAGSTFAPAMSTALSAVNTVMSGASQALADGFQPADIAVVGTLLKDTFISTLNGISENIPELTETFSQTLTQVITTLTEILPEMLPVLLNAISLLLKELLNAITSNIDPFVKLATDLLTQLAGFLCQNLPIILEAAMTILTALINGFVTALPTLMPQITGILTGLVDVFIANIGLLLEAGLQLLLALVKGIAESLPVIIPQLVQALLTIVSFLIDNIDIIIEAGIALLMGLMAGLISAIPVLISYLPVLIQKITAALIQNLPLIITSGIMLIVQLIAGLVQAIPLIIAAMPQIISTIFNAFSTVDWGKIGHSLISGIIKGFLATKQMIDDAIKNIASTVINGFKKLFQINSPSKVMRKLGTSIGKGVSMGIEDTIPQVTGALEEIMPDNIASKYNLALSADRYTKTNSYGQIPFSSSAIDNSTTSVVYNINVSGDALQSESGIRSLAQKLETYRLQTVRQKGG